MPQIWLWLCVITLEIIFTYLFSPPGKLAGRAIYFADVFFFIFYILKFLMVDFLTRVSQQIMKRSSPKFQDW